MAGTAVGVGVEASVGVSAPVWVAPVFRAGISVGVCLVLISFTAVVGGCWGSNNLTTIADAAHFLGGEAIAVPEAAPGWVGFVVRAVLVPAVHGAVVSVDTLSSCWLFWGGSAWSADIESTDGPCWVGWGHALPFLLVP